MPKLPLAFVGTGDLFTALTTAWLKLTNGDLPTTLEKVIASMQAVLKRTQAHTLKFDKPSAKEKELKLIQSKRDIEEPNVHIKATKLEN